MSIMMSESLKGIVSIGQLDGDDCVLSLTIDDEQYTLDVYSFVRHVDHAVVKCISSRDLIDRCLSSQQAIATLSFAGKDVCAGKVRSVGFEVYTRGDESHDAVILHMDRDI